MRTFALLALAFASVAGYVVSFALEHDVQVLQVLACGLFAIAVPAIPISLHIECHQDDFDL